MLHKIFSVYDSKAELYLTPFFMKTKGEAVRGFEDVANDKNSAIGRHAEDYTLFELGEYDDCSAIFSLHKTPISIGVALEFVKS